jgi:hypothetical protein
MPGFHDGAVAVQGPARPTRPEVINRVRALRRRALAPVMSGAPDEPSLQRQIEQLQAQVAHLEQLVQGLQDSVYRDVRRHDDQIVELQERIAPAAIAAALSKDERERGL